MYIERSWIAGPHQGCLRTKLNNQVTFLGLSVHRDAIPRADRPFAV